MFEQEPLPADSPLLDPAIEDRMPFLPSLRQWRQDYAAVTDPAKGMAGRCVQGLLDVLEGNYGGDTAKMPYVVNKEVGIRTGEHGEGI